MTISLREKRYRQCLNSIERLTEQREQAFRRLCAYSHRLMQERRRLAYYAKFPKVVPDPVEPYEHIPDPDPVDWAPQQTIKAVLEEEDPIPDFLKRKAVHPADIEAAMLHGKAKDAKAKAELQAEQAARKTAKARGRIARMKAKQAGELKKMPLTGRAALKAIREG